MDGNHFGAQGCQRILKKLTDLNKRDVLDEIEDDEEPEVKMNLFIVKNLMKKSFKKNVEITLKIQF